jgi:RimJ/RimL family protein N-acetyltransferase
LDIEHARRRKFRIDLETPRFLLRPLIADDADWLADLLADPEVNRFLLDDAMPADEARETAEAIVSLDLMKSHFGQWAIQDKSTGAIHGWTELSKLRPWSGPSDEIALSYVLRRASWGQGIATEAAGRLLRCAFEVQRLHRVMAVIMAGNRPSERVLEKLGMRFIKAARSADRKNLRYFRIDAPRLAGSDETASSGPGEVVANQKNTQCFRARPLQGSCRQLC